MASVTIIDPRTKTSGIGHLIETFRNAKALDSKAIGRLAETLDAMDSRMAQMEVALRTPAPVLPIEDPADLAVTINDVPPVLLPIPAQATRNTKGDNFSVRSLGARGDAITVLDGQMTSGAPILHSASYTFSAKDIAKIALVKGAGAAGADLQAVVLSATAGGNANLSINAATTVTASTVTFGTDDTVAFLAAFARSGQCLIPQGRFIVNAQLLIRNQVALSVRGYGAASVVIPTVNLNASFMDLSGSVDIDLSGFQVDGRYLRDIAARIIHGDGTVSNPTYGNISVRDCLFSNCPWPVVGLGASVGNTVQDIQCQGNKFYNCGYGTHGVASGGPNTVDISLGGTKRRIAIRDNRFAYVTQPASNPGNAIFVGNGVTEDVDISANRIWDSPSVGINVQGRSFVLEPSSVSGVTIENNLIRRSRWSGITLFGIFQGTIVGNTVVDAGFAKLGTIETRCSILVSTGITGAGAVEVGGSDFVIQGNSLYDTDGDINTLRGILESTIGGSSKDSIYEAGPNIIGGISNPLVLGTKCTIISFDQFTKKWSIGKATQSAQFNLQDNLRVESSISHLFSEMTTKPAISAGGFMLCWGINATFDGVNWISGYDGANNGFAVIGVEYGGVNLKMFVVPSTGGTSQVVSPATLATYLSMTLNATSATIPGLFPALANFPSGPTIASDATITTSNLVARYTQIGKLVLVRIAVDVSVTAGTGHYVSATLPVTAITNTTQDVQSLSGCWGPTSGPGVNVAFETSGNKVRATIINGGTVTAGFSGKLILSGSYEAA